MKITKDWKTNTLIVGALLGLFSGLLASFLLVRRAEKSGQELALSSGEGFRLGMLVLGLLREIATLG
jgi:ABC-type Mn2+/Zn2+ transport system permease subunit